MTDRARRVVDEAKKLPVSERAQVIAELLASLEGEPEPDADAEWAREIERRAAAVAAGEPSAGEAEAVIAEIEAELRRR